MKLMFTFMETMIQLFDQPGFTLGPLSLTLFQSPPLHVHCSRDQVTQAPHKGIRHAATLLRHAMSRFIKTTLQ